MSSADATASDRASGAVPDTDNRTRESQARRIK